MLPLSLSLSAFSWKQAKIGVSAIFFPWITFIFGFQFILQATSNNFTFIFSNFTIPGHHNLLMVDPASQLSWWLNLNFLRFSLFVSNLGWLVMFWNFEDFYIRRILTLTTPTTNTWYNPTAPLDFTTLFFLVFDFSSSP